MSGSSTSRMLPQEMTAGTPHPGWPNTSTTAHGKLFANNATSTIELVGDQWIKIFSYKLKILKLWTVSVPPEPIKFKSRAPIADHQMNFSRSNKIIKNHQNVNHTSSHYTLHHLVPIFDARLITSAEIGWKSSLRSEQNITTWRCAIFKRTSVYGRIGIHLRIET